MPELTEMHQSICRFKHMSTLYKIEYYYGSSIIALYEWQCKGFFKRWRWVKIYQGFETPLEQVVEFYKKEKAKDTVLMDRMNNRQSGKTHDNDDYDEDELKDKLGTHPSKNST